MAGKLINISGRLHSREVGNVVAGADEIYDDEQKRKQSDINREVSVALSFVPKKTSQLENDSQFVSSPELEEQLGGMQKKITTVVAQETEDGGNPSAEASIDNDGKLSFAFKNLKLRFKDLSAADKEALRGPQGVTTVYDPENPTDLLSTLQTTAGWSQQHTMTQKAITEAIESNTVNVVKSWVKADLDEMTKYQAISPSTGNVVSSSASWGSRRIAVSAYRGMRIRFVTGNSYQAVITFVKSWVSTAGNPADFCDGISSVTTIDKNEVYDTVIPDDCTYLYVGCLSQGSTVSPTLVSIFSTANERLDALEVKDTETEGKIKDMEDSLYIPEKVWLSSELSSLSTQWPISSSGSFTATSGNNSARRIAFSAYKGMMLEITANADYTARYAFMKAWPSSSGVSASGYYCEGETIRTLSKGKSTRVEIPSDCLYLYVDNKYSGNLYLPKEIKVVSYITEKVETKLSRVYLSASGNDENDGSTSAKAKATFAAAMNAGAADMTLVLSSDITEPMNFSAWSGQKTRVTVRGTADVRRKVILGKMLAELQQYSNYDDVYTWQPGTGESLPSGNVKWLWQHELPDASTEINSDERHPLQRGRQYRRLSTCIEPVTSIADLLSASTPCWVVDSGTLYIRAATGSSVATNPIVIPTNSQAAIVGTGFELNLFNIEAWYGHIESGSGYNFRAVDCAARYSVGDGAWMINDAMCAHLERCEADSNTMPTKASGSLPTGDGFNIHPTSGEDIYAKGGTHTLIDCWAHDNRDDGYSDHGRSEGTIIGGLYEYNGKGGLTPAVGAHDTIYNAVCRNHPTGSGILFTGAPGSSEGGMGGQVECFGCVCTSNKWNYKVDGALSGSPEPNRMILNHCISRNASEAALYAQTNSKILARECTDSGSATKKKESGGSTSITIDNGTLIS